VFAVILHVAGSESSADAISAVAILASELDINTN